MSNLEPTIKEFLDKLPKEAGKDDIPPLLAQYLEERFNIEPKG